MLELVDVSVHLGRRWVLQEVSLIVRPGEVLAICGANGAGKSTLLKAVLGEVPATGTIRLNGLEVVATKPSRLAPLRAVLPQAGPLAGIEVGAPIHVGWTADAMKVFAA